MSGRVREEVGSHVVGGLDQFLAVLLQLPDRVAPGEVGIALGEADPGQFMHHGRPGERLGQEQHVRILGLDVADQPLPEVQRFGVRVVDPEDLHPALDPEHGHPQHFAGQPGRVVVEVERVDVLVLLGWILGVGDGPVRQRGEPLRMLLHPRDGRARIAAPGPARPPCPVPGSGPRTRRSRSRRRVADGWRRGRPRSDPIAHGEPTSVSARVQGVVRALAVDLADRMDRWQVDHVEAEVGHVVQVLGGVGEGAVPHRPGLVGPGRRPVPRRSTAGRTRTRPRTAPGPGRSRCCSAASG